MTILEVLLIGVGLSMDAVAVSMTNGMVYKHLSSWRFLAVPLFFGVFQGIMPFLGYLAGGLFAEIISKYAGIVILAILGVIGGKMLKEGLCNHPQEAKKRLAGDLAWITLFFQAVATSVDAFAVGVGFSAAQIEILPAVGLIAVTTFILSALALLTGQKSGDILGNKAEALGGLILIVIGVKAVL